MLVLFIKLDQTFIDLIVIDPRLSEKLDNPFMGCIIVPFRVLLFRVFFDDLVDLPFTHLLTIVISFLYHFDTHPAKLVVENRTYRVPKFNYIS